MVFRGKHPCRKPKVLGEKGADLVHNAGEGENSRRLQRSILYVNICNLSTPDIVVFKRKTTDILWRVNIIIETILCQNMRKSLKNKEKLDFLRQNDIITPTKRTWLKSV